MDFRSYPYLTREEFAEVCHNLDRQYCRATLGPTRQQWKLRVNTALDTSFLSKVEYVTYVQIIRPLEAVLDHASLSAEIERLTIGAFPTELGIDQAMVDAEDSDKVVIISL
jgi:ubiquitin-like-conjugating enzyme ATG10